MLVVLRRIPVPGIPTFPSSSVRGYPYDVRFLVGAIVSSCLRCCTLGLAAVSTSGMRRPGRVDHRHHPDSKSVGLPASDHKWGSEVATHSVICRAIRYWCHHVLSRMLSRVFWLLAYQCVRDSRSIHPVLSFVLGQCCGFLWFSSIRHPTTAQVF